jgi:hypothetical protein
VVLGRIRRAMVKKDLLWGTKKFCLDEAINTRQLDDFSLIGELSGDIYVNSGHRIDLSNLKYHRNSHGYS